MGITGKYDFKGIKKYGARGIEAAIAATTWGASLVRIPLFTVVEDLFFQLAVNWLANKGLIVMNIGAILIDGEVDQKNLDQAIEKGLQTVQLGREKLTPRQGKAIDDAVREAARRNIKFNPTT
jgi:hypothetical protein